MLFWFGFPLLEVLRISFLSFLEDFLAISAESNKLELLPVAFRLILSTLLLWIFVKVESFRMIFGCFFSLLRLRFFLFFLLKSGW